MRERRGPPCGSMTARADAVVARTAAPGGGRFEGEVAVDLNMRGRCGGRHTARSGRRAWPPRGWHWARGRPVVGWGVRAREGVDAG